MQNSPGGDHRHVLEEVKSRQARAADALVPWFYENMPEYYFKTHTDEERIRHLQAIMSGQVMEERQAVSLKSPCGTRVTYLTPGGDMAALIRVLEQNAHLDIKTARIYSSLDQALRLDTFLVGDLAQCSTTSEGFGDALTVLKGIDLLPPEREREFSDFLATASEDYVDKFEPARAVRHFNICKRIAGTERVHVVFEPDSKGVMDRFMIAMDDPPHKGLLLQIAKVFARRKINISRAYGDEFTAPGGRSTAVISLYVDCGQCGLPGNQALVEELSRELKRVKWFASHELERLADEDGWPLSRVNLLMAACEFAHQFLLKTNLYAYTSDKIVRAVLRNRELAGKLVTYFEARFDPEFSGDRHVAIEAARDQVRAMLENISDDITRNIFGCILRFFRRIQRTNYYMPDRLGLSFRMDPQILRLKGGEDRPYGFYCFHGPLFFGFQVRYRDMARGGVRVVRTRTQEQFELESNRLFDEVTKLARAQQQKNKDIPEGGSKAVLLLGPEGDVDLAVRSMADSLLDLITIRDGALDPRIVDYLGREEIIYLGPDENITPAHIEWIVARAARRGYRWPSAIMSSKPRAGINHKEYGVTSEGVVVFAEETLKYAGIDPRERPFRVKLTGGPAGDVASNAVRILIREFGENAVITAMSDGHGAIFDPEGLDHGELLRLIDAGLPTTGFHPERIKGADGFVASSDTPEGARQRDELHNRVRADLFIPAGGRPDTINIKNWSRFFDSEGAPSARVMVEGANIFISPEARSRFEQRGVLVVPGPSANKTGVICSSYEILVGLVLSEEEFLAIKEEYVTQVLDILRRRAGDEARLLIREHRLSAGIRSLTRISTELSKAINGLGDMIRAVLEEDVERIEDHPALRDVMFDYCPAVLVERYGDRLVRDVPRAHQLSLLAAHIASRILYNEGLGWIEALTGVREVREIVAAYLDEEREVAGLIRRLEDSGLEGREEIIRILRASGRKYLTMDRLGLE